MTLLLMFSFQVCSPVIFAWTDGPVRYVLSHDYDGGRCIWEPAPNEPKRNTGNMRGIPYEMPTTVDPQR